MTTADPPRPSPTRWLAMAMIGLGVSMIIIDATIVNVALPVIIRALPLTFNEAEWVNSIYAVVFAALLIPLGRLGDTHGRKRLYLLGLACFVFASLCAGVAQNSGELLAARVLQGVGAAAILPATLSTLNATFRGRERILAFAFWGSIIGGMAALGPLAGGWLTTSFSWRWAFLVNLPVAVVVVAGTILWVPESKDDAAPRGRDLPGTLTLSLSMTALVFTLIEGQHYGWWSPDQPFAVGGWHWPIGGLSVIPFTGTLAVVCFGLFLLVERNKARKGQVLLVDFRLFVYRSYAFGNLVGLVISLGEYGIIFVLPLFLQGVLGFSAFQTGGLFLSLALGSFLAGGLATPLTHWLGARRVVSLGVGSEVVGICGTAALLAQAMQALTLVPFLFVYGIGVGLASARLTSVILSEIPPAQSGQASGMQSTFRQVGSALGIAILGTVVSVVLDRQTMSQLARIPGFPLQARTALAATVRETGGQVLATLRTQSDHAVVVAVSNAVTDAARWAACVAAALVACAFVLTWWLPEDQA